MSEYTQAALAWLRGIDPLLPAALLITFVLVVIYSIRRWKPTWWLMVESTVPWAGTLDPGPAFNIWWAAWQAWPAMALSTATSALIAGTSVKNAECGALCGAISAAVHVFMANYEGKVGDLKKPRPPSPPYTPERSVHFPPDPKVPSIPPPAAAMRGYAMRAPIRARLVATLVGGSALIAGIALCLSISGCTWLEKTAWPIAEHCAPSTSTLLNQVQLVLLAGGDVESKLTELAQQLGVDGKTFVECAVQEFIDTPGALTSEQVAAKARGKAFLVKVHQ